MVGIALLSTILFAISAHGCLDHDTHQHGKRDIKSASITLPSRPLVWGDVNVIHTTDTHGWLLGHQKASPPEPNYSGDFGEFSSFVEHMNETAKQKKVDLLLVDSGDLHDGSGLTDGYLPGGVDGQDANKFVQKLPYDVMTVGNHELYNYTVALDMYTNFIPNMKGRYLTSNVNITVAGKDVPMGERWVNFTTPNGKRVTAFGVLFNFTGQDKNITVQNATEMVKEKWFLDAITTEPNLFLLVGHMPVSKDNWPVVVDTIRKKHGTTPIMIFGGHSHVRDCVPFGNYGMALQSGRYMETVGWMSANISSPTNTTFSRRYLDANRVTYEFHAQRHGVMYDTPTGMNITQGLKALAKNFSLDTLYGFAPRDFTFNQACYPSINSLPSLYIEEAAPYALSIHNNNRSSVPNLIIVNSGIFRFDVYAGTFTKNDQLTAVDNPDKWMYVPKVKLSVANQILDAMNKGCQVHHSNSSVEELESRERELYAKGYIDTRSNERLEEMEQRNEIEGRDFVIKTLGYVTNDTCGLIGDGDDTPHIVAPSFNVPRNIASRPPNVTADTLIDVVFNDHIQNRTLDALNCVQNITKYRDTDVQVYSSLLTNEVLGEYAKVAWKTS